jgi:hypothetical protein
MKKKLTEGEQKSLLTILQHRFADNMGLHKGLNWADIEEKLLARPELLWTISEMERTGGTPDLVKLPGSESVYYIDCSAESPKGRRSLCYDLPAWEYRKENKPESNAMDEAAEMGIELLDEADYRALQELGSFDLKTSSWVVTPEPIRKLGGALFCDRRYNTVFVYHNGAESYYAARGFRGKLSI